MLQAKKLKIIGFNKITNETVTRYELANGYWEATDSIAQTLNCFETPNVSEVYRKLFETF